MPNLTEAYASGSPLPEKGQRLVYDSHLKGFGLRLTPGSRTWIVEVRGGGRSQRITLGPVGVLPHQKARRKAQEALLAGLEGRPVREGRRSMTDLWLRMETEWLPRLSPGSQQNVRGYWNNHIQPVLGAHVVADVTANEISELLAGIEGNATCNRTHECLRRMFGFAQRWEWLSKNPATGWERRREVARAAYLTRDELARLLDALPPTPSGDALRTAALTGCRIGEALGMSWTQLRDDARLWVKNAATTKQRKEHVIPVPDIVRDILLKQPRYGEFVFSREDGSRIKTVRKVFAWALKRAGLPHHRIHDLRHTFASALINSGSSLVLVGAALGHSVPATTQRYSHLATDTLREAMSGVVVDISSRRNGITTK